MGEDSSGASAADSSQPSTTVGTERSTGVYTNFGPCDPKHVLLRLEHCRHRDVKGVVFLSYVVMILAAVPTVMVVVLVETQSVEFFVSSSVYNKIAVACATVTLAAEVSMILYFLLKYYQAKQQKLIWTHRRRRIFTCLSMELLLTTASTAVNVAANSIAINQHCVFFGKTLAVLAFVRNITSQMVFLLQMVDVHSLMPWRLGVDPKGINRVYGVLPKWRREEHLKNVTKEAPMVVDLPIWFHLPKVLYWCFHVTPFILLLNATLQIADQWNAEVAAGLIDPQTCFPYSVEVSANDFCPTAGQHKKSVVAYLTAGILLMGLVVYMALLHFVRKAMDQEPSSKYRLAKMALELHLRMNAPGAVMSTLLLVVVALTTLTECSKFVTTWYFGTIGLELVQGFFKVFDVYLFAPTIVRDDSLQRLWMEELLWSERESGNVLDSHVHGEPVFCFETLVKLLYWSMLTYYYGEEHADSKYDMETALKLYGMHSYQLVYEPSTDTKGLLAWGPDAAVLAFRGTTTLENVKSDLQVTRDLLHAEHFRGAEEATDRATGEGRGNGKKARIRRGDKTAMRVHAGFLKAWRVNGTNVMVLEKIKQLLQESPGMQVYFTGHSLGGALATLSVFDIALFCNCQHQLVCYTFGSPRIGNHAFCRVYNQLVPNMWRIVNGQDVVARRGKLMGAYKHCGSMVLVNKTGDMLVRPTFLERHVWNTPGAINVKHHLLTTYVLSIAKVIADQVSPRAYHSGRAGLRLIGRDPIMQDVLRDVFNFNSDTMSVMEKSSESKSQRSNSNGKALLDTEGSKAFGCFGMLLKPNDTVGSGLQNSRSKSINEEAGEIVTMGNSKPESSKEEVNKAVISVPLENGNEVMLTGDEEHSANSKPMSDIQECHALQSKDIEMLPL